MNRLFRFPISHQLKANTVRTHGHAKALYGCEATSAADNFVDRYSTSVLNNLFYNNGNRSADLTYQFASRGDDADPRTEIGARRVAMFRRMSAKDPEINAILADSFKILQNTTHAAGQCNRRPDLRTLNPPTRSIELPIGRMPPQTDPWDTFYTPYMKLERC